MNIGRQLLTVIGLLLNLYCFPARVHTKVQLGKEGGEKPMITSQAGQLREPLTHKEDKKKKTRLTEERDVKEAPHSH